MKETYYLRHDYNSRNDEKVLRLRQKYPNGAGYALFWMLSEKLAESSEGRLKIQDIDVLAFELQMESEWIADVITTSGLFEVDKGFFWSNRLLSDLAARSEKSKKATLANKIRWDNVRKEVTKNPDGLRTDSKRNPRKGKERKGEERKGEERKGEKDSSPAEKMKIFINSVKEKDSNYEKLVSSIAEKNIPISTVIKEIDRFTSYWCELTKSGTKQKWEMQETFEVQKRLTTWFNRSNENVQKPSRGITFA